MPIALPTWLRPQARAMEPATLVEPVLLAAPRPRDPEWGHEYKQAVGSAGIKSIVREGRMEEAYQIRTGSDTAFEAYADFDTQQERMALANRVAGPGYLALSETLAGRSALSEGLGNRRPAEVWAMREEWMPSISHFVEEAAFNLRAEGIWPARITAHLSAGGHGLPGLFALFASAAEFPRADRHAHLIVPEGDVERTEIRSLLDALRHGELAVDSHLESMPWKARRPLALTILLRDNRRGRDDLDEVAAHIAAALSARVRFETGSSENLSNLMRRLTKHATLAGVEPCPLTFHYASAAVPVGREGRRPVDLPTLLPLADATLRSVRHGAARRALDVDMDRYLLLVTAPCNEWDDVRRMEQYVLDRLEFAGSPERQCLGVFFSGYRPDPTNREECVFAIKLGAVGGGWNGVYRAILGPQPVVPLTRLPERPRVATERPRIGWEGIS